MPEIDANKLARIVGHDEDAEVLKKSAKIIKDKKQLSIRIPAKFSEQAKINPEKDYFEFHLIPIDEEGTEFTIEADLIRGKDDGAGA